MLTNIQSSRLEQNHERIHAAGKPRNLNDAVAFSYQGFKPRL